MEKQVRFGNAFEAFDVKFENLQVVTVKPHIGEDGYWYVGTQNTGVKAEGQDGHTPVITIVDGYWYVDGVNTNVKAVGQDGRNGQDGKDGVNGKDGLTPHIGGNGNWWIGDTDTGVNAKGPKATSELINDSDFATNQSVDQKVADLVNSAPEALDTLGELATALNNHEDAYDALLETVGKKVDKVEGKGLSTNDFTTAYKTTLDSLAKVATSGAYADLSGKPTIPTATSELTNNSDFATNASVDAKLGDKVDKVSGKGLSTNDYTTGEKNKLASIANTIALTGDVTGSATFNGNGTLSISTKVVNGGGGGTAELPTIIIKTTETSGVLDAETQAKLYELLNSPAIMHLVVDVQTEAYGGALILHDAYQFSRFELDEVAQGLFMVCSSVSANSTKVLKVQILYGSDTAWHITTASGGGGGATLLIQGVDPALPMGEITADQSVFIQTAILPLLDGDASQLAGSSVAVIVGDLENGFDSIEVYRYSYTDLFSSAFCFTTQSPLGTKTLMFSLEQGMWMIAEPNHLLINIDEGQTSGQISFVQLISLQVDERAVLNSAVSLVDADLNMSTYRFVETGWKYIADNEAIALMKYSKITDKGISMLTITSTGEADEGGLPITTWEVTTTPFGSIATMLNTEV